MSRLLTRRLLGTGRQPVERPGHGDRLPLSQATVSFVEAARILTARCGLAERIEFQQATALALPFEDSTFDHVWSYAVTMNIADKEGLGRDVTRVLKPGGRFSCNEIARGSGGASVFPLPWADDEVSSFLVSPAEMRAALEAGGLSLIEQVDLTASRLGEAGRRLVIEHDDFPLRQHNLQSCLADRHLIAQFILAEKRIWGPWQPPRLSSAKAVELLSVLPHDRRRRLQPDPDAMSLIDIGALRSDASDDIFGSQYRRHPATSNVCSLG